MHEGYFYFCVLERYHCETNTNKLYFFLPIVQWKIQVATKHIRSCGTQLGHVQSQNGVHHIATVSLLNMFPRKGVKRCATALRYVFYLVLCVCVSRLF